MKQFTITIPDSIELNQKETKRFLAAKLFEAGILSLGQAADLAELSKLAFSEILTDYGVSLVNYSLSDTINDAARF